MYFNVFLLFLKKFCDNVWCGGKSNDRIHVNLNQIKTFWNHNPKCRVSGLGSSDCGLYQNKAWVTKQRYVCDTKDAIDVPILSFMIETIDNISKVMVDPPLQDTKHFGFEIWVKQVFRREPQKKIIINK